MTATMNSDLFRKAGPVIGYAQVHAVDLVVAGLARLKHGSIEIGNKPITCGRFHAEQCVRTWSCMQR